jgi:hypothetical protein
LDSVLWGVSRVSERANPSQGLLNTWNAASFSVCGGSGVFAPADVRLCGGKLYDAVSDGGGQSVLAMYPKQPFNFAGRTGKVVFDVSANSEGPHAAWPEFWITDQPVPVPNRGVSGVATYAANSFGFAVDQGCAVGMTGISELYATKANKRIELPLTVHNDCSLPAGSLGQLNHFEVRISQSHVEVWASPPASTRLQLLVSADDVGLTFTQGVVWVEDAHYNACKSDTQCTHTFAWDNVGFDGPKTYRDRTFDVADNTQRSGAAMNLGWELGATAVSLKTMPVAWDKIPTKALVTLSWYAESQTVPSVRVNGGPAHTVAWPYDAQTSVWRTIAIEVPFSEVRTGINTLAFTGDDNETLANVNLSLINAADVP